MYAKWALKILSLSLVGVLFANVLWARSEYVRQDFDYAGFNELNNTATAIWDSWVRKYGSAANAEVALFNRGFQDPQIRELHQNAIDYLKSSYFSFEDFRGINRHKYAYDIDRDQVDLDKPLSGLLRFAFANISLALLPELKKEMLGWFRRMMNYDGDFMMSFFDLYGCYQQKFEGQGFPSCRDENRYSDRAYTLVRIFASSRLLLEQEDYQICETVINPQWMYIYLYEIHEFAPLWHRGKNSFLDQSPLMKCIGTPSVAQNRRLDAPIVKSTRLEALIKNAQKFVVVE